MTLTGANEAKQERSQRTLEKILEAAEELLQTKDFDELTMASLAKRAGYAVGTLYGRIPNKDSLLVCLYQRLQRQIHRESEAMYAADIALSLEERVRLICEVSVEFVHATRGVNRAITLHLWSRRGDELGFRRSTTASFKQAAAFLAACEGEIAHGNPREACEFGLLTVTNMAQQCIVFGDRSGVQLRYSRRDLKQRLTALLLAHLRTAS